MPKNTNGPFVRHKFIPPAHFERIQQASGEKWVVQEFARMKRQGTDQQLLEDDPLA